jgi:hypothetical protein
MKPRTLILALVAVALIGSFSAIKPDSVSAQERLGGLGVSEYCQSRGYAGALTVKPVIGPGAAYDNWYCGGANAESPVDFFAACRWQYPNHTITNAAPDDPNHAYTWVCYGFPDADHDRVPDASDNCPNQPEDYDGHLDSDGCPESGGGPPVVIPDSILKRLDKTFSDVDLNAFIEALKSATDTFLCALDTAVWLTKGSQSPQMAEHCADALSAIADIVDDYI